MIQSAFSGGCLTAPGNGGLQVFLVTGVGVESFVAKIFRPSRRVPLSGRTLRHGHLVSEDTVVDEVLLACDPGRASVEISAHGGEATRHAVEHLLRSRGVAWLEASELSRREVGSCFGAGLHRAAREAMDRAYAPSAVGFFLEVCDGALGHEIVALAQALGANSDGAGPDRMSAAASRLETLVARGVLGRAFTQPPLVVLLGAPNAGKSSLANALVGEDVAIVTDQPGTTRDVLRERVLVRGFPFELADTAGLRRSSDPVEREGVARATAVAQRAAIVIHVVDGRRGAADLEDERRELPTSPALTVATHVDLTPGLDIPALEVALRCRVVAWSAVTSVGLERIRDELLFRSPFRGPASSMFPAPFTERQIAWLSAAADDVRNGRGALARERLEALACDGGA